MGKSRLIISDQQAFSTRAYFLCFRSFAPNLPAAIQLSLEK